MSQIWMDVDAALSAVPVNIVALIDDTDFKTREESVTFDQSGLDLVWNFVTTAGAYTQTAVTPTDTAGDYDWVNKGNGMYSIEIPASAGASINNDTEGFGWFSGFATGILPWTGPVIGFRSAALNNLLIDDATAMTNFNIVFNTDFATNYNTTRDAWVTNYTDIIGTVPIVTYGLDHLVSASVADEVVDDSIIAKMVDAGGTADWSNFANGEDSLRAISEAVAAIGSATGGGFHFVPLSDDVLEDTTDAAAAVDKGTTPETVGIPVTGHAFLAGDEVTIAATANYNGQHVVDSVSVDEVVIVATFAAETFAGTDTIKRTIKATRLVGTEDGGTFASVAGQDLVYHIIGDDGNNFAISYRYDVGSDRRATEVTFTGYLNSGNDTALIQAYDFVGSAWETRATFDGQNGNANQVHNATLLARNTGTSGVEFGQVLIRVKQGASSSSPTLNIDNLEVEAVGIGQTAGYQNGQIWYDSVNGTDGEVKYTHGTADVPCKTMDNVIALVASGLSPDVHVLNGSTVTLAASAANYSFFGDNWILQLGSQDVAGAYFQGATVSGVGTSASEVHYEGCDIGTMSVQKGHFDFCAFNGTVTMTLAGDYKYHNCYSNVAGAGSPTFTKTAGQAITAAWRNWMDSITVSGIEAGDVMTINGRLGTVTLNGAEGSVQIRGTYKEIVDNRTGTPTLNIAGAIKGEDVATILVDSSELQSVLSAGILARSNNATLETLLGVDDDAAEDTLVFQNWEEILTGSTHNVTNSSGKLLRQIAGSIFTDGTAQSGGVNSLQLASGDVSYNGEFQRARLVITGGTGFPAEFIITGSTASTDTVTFTPAANAALDVSTTYQVVPGQAHTTVQNGGYDDGYVFVDTVNGSAGTVSGVNGTSTNPSSSMSDAYTIAGNENLTKFQIEPGSAVVLPSDSTGFNFGTSVNSGWTLDLNGQEIGSSTFIRASVVTGTGLNTSGGQAPNFTLCGMGNVTMPPCTGHQCGFFGTFTIGSAGDFTFGESADVFNLSLTIDYGAALNASEFFLQSWGGGNVEIQNAGAGTGSYVFEMNGIGDLTVNANCSATTTVTLRGNISRNADVTGITYVEIANVTTSNVWSETTRTLTAATNITSDGTAITMSSSGVVGTVNLVNTLTTYTGNTLQTADVATLITTVGAAGVGLTDLGGMSTGMKGEVESEANDALVAFWTTPATLIDLILDEVNTGGTHNVTNSLGKQVRQAATTGLYEGGQIWIDTTGGGSAGTDVDENGTVDNPSDNIADATTIAVAKGLKKFMIAPGSSFTLAQTYSSYIFSGDNGVTIAMGGQTLTGCVFRKVTVTGIAVSATSMTFDCCRIGTTALTCTLPLCRIYTSTIVNDITANSTGNYFFDRCHSGVAGTATWTFDFGDAIGNTNLNMRAYSGGVTLESMGDTGTDVASIEGWGQVIEGTCAGGTVVIRGAFTISGFTNLTLSDDARIDVAQINVALAAIHLDHLFAVDYDPASKPGVATALLNELIESNAGVSRYTAAALAQAPSGSTTVTDITAAALAKFASVDTGETTSVDGSVAKLSQGGGAAGPGSESCTFTIVDEVGDPVVGAEVWVSTDAAGSNVVAGTLFTSDAGKVTFLLDLGVTYYIWKDHADVNFTNPEAHEVTA